MAKTQVNLILEESEKEGFEAATKNHPHAENLSHFLRIAARNEVTAIENDASNDDDAVEVDLSEVTETTSTILNELDTMKEQLETIDVQTDETKEVRECASEIIQYIPKEPEAEIVGRDPMGDDFGPIEDRVMTAGRLTDIVTLLTEQHDYDEYTVRRAASKAENEITDLHTTSVDGQLRYYFFNETTRGNDATAEESEK